MNKFIEPIEAFEVNIESFNSCGYGSDNDIYENHGYGSDNGNGYLLAYTYCGDGSGGGKGYGRGAAYNTYYGYAEFKPQNLYGKYR